MERGASPWQELKNHWEGVCVVGKEANDSHKEEFRR